MTAAPYRRHKRAWRKNSSSPAFSEMELTIPLPCRQRNPASIISHREESTMMGIRAMSGSDAIKLRKVIMASVPSSNPSSMFTSKICAPP